MLLAWLLWFAFRRGGVRQRDYKLALTALNEISAKADLYKDLDSVLATDIRTIMQKYRKETDALK